MEPVKIITQDEQSQLLTHAFKSNLRDFTMIALCLHTGLRNNELISLQISDVYDCEDVLLDLTVRAEIAKGRHVRSIPLNNTIRGLLTKFYSWKIDMLQSINSYNHLFLSHKSHRKLSPRDFQRIVQRLSLESINRPVHPHSLRHTFATNLLSVTNIRVIQNLLGHRHLNSTQIYTHPNSDDMKLAVEQL